MNLLSRFQFRPILTVAMLISLAILISLGTWQMQRLQWKNDLIAKTEARINAPPIPFGDALARQLAGEDMTYTPVSATGAYFNENEIHVFGTLDAKAGYYVFTPFVRKDDDQMIFINRGFIPQKLKEKSARKKGLLKGSVKVSGLFRMPETVRGVAAMVKPADLPQVNEWHQRNPAAFATASGIDAAFAYIDSNGAENPGDWPRGGTTRLDFRNKHFEYALTWYGLAAALIGVWIAFSLQPRKKSNNFKK